MECGDASATATSRAPTSRRARGAMALGALIALAACGSRTTLVAPDAVDVGADASVPCTASPGTLATDQHGPTAIVTDGERVYWVDVGHVGTGLGSIQSAPVCGGEVTTLADAQPFPLDLAVDATHVYWTDAARGAVLRVAKEGGAIETLTADALGAYAIAVDAAGVYWTSPQAGTVSRVDKTGGAPSRLAIASSPYDVAVDGGRVYFTDQQRGEIVAVDEAGGDPVVLATGEDRPTAIAVDADRVYWADIGGGSGAIEVRSVAKRGGASASVVRASMVVDLHAAGDQVFWSDLDGDAIFSAPTTGGAATARVRGSSPYGFAVRDGAVYWTSLGDPGSVARSPL